jgi:curved DNA-binding protein CbpA
MPQTYYEILGIDPKASEKEVKSAFRALARKHHPDVQGDPAKFREIYEAYEVLMNSDKRAKYDRLGHVGYKSEGQQSEVHYPSYEEIFKEMVLKKISTETPFDGFVRGYPSVYFGEEVEDPYTGDIYSSAEDIRIAKADRAYAIYTEQMEKIRDSLYGEIKSIEKLRKLTAVMLNSKWIEDAEYNESMRLIDEYEIRDKEHKSELARSERAEEIGDPIQEEAELKQALREGAIKGSRQIDEKRPGRRNDPRGGHRHGEDPDERKQWRKETGEGRKLR